LIQASKTDSQKTNGITSRLVTLAALFMAAFFLYLALRDLDWATFWQTLIHGQYQYLALTIPVSSANYFLRSLRWGFLVRSEKKIPHLSVFWANMVGYMGNSFLPARAGEVLRSVAISRNFGLSTSFTLATALTERVMDVVALVIISSLSLLYLNLLSTSFSAAIQGVALLGVIGLIIVLCSPLLENHLLYILKHLPLPQGWIEKIANQLSLFLQGMRTLQNGKRMASFLALTILIWLIDGYAMVIGANLVSSVLTLPQSLVFLSGLGLSSAIPSTPGYVGVYQFVAVSILVPFGFTKSSAVALILISQVANYLIVGFWGLIGLWMLKTNQSGLAGQLIE